MLINQEPSVSEDSAGRLGLSKNYRVMQTYLRSMGIDIVKDCVWINSVMCYGKDKALPLNIDACRSKVIDIIHKYKPNVIIPIGRLPLLSIIGEKCKFKIGGFEKWRGWQIPDQDLNAWVCPINKPDSIFLVKNDSLKNIFIQDLKNALKQTYKKVPTISSDASEFIHVLKDTDEILHQLGVLLNQGGDITIDYEATGLSLRRAGHAIKSVSYTYNDSLETFTFLLNKQEIIDKWIEVLKSTRIVKSAANMKYEMNCSRVAYNTRIECILLDTMLLTHIYDNRNGITGVKFQTYAFLGIADYASHITPLLMSSEKDRLSDGANAFNNIDKIPTDELLYYNGCDTFYESLIARYLIEKMNIQHWIDRKLITLRSF